MYDPIVSSIYNEKATSQVEWLCFLHFCIHGLGKAIYSMSVDLYALIAWIFIALTEWLMISFR